MSTLTRRLDSPLVLSVLAVAACLLVVTRYTERFTQPLSCFILPGITFADPQRVPAGIAVLPDDGYDGQFYYRLALHPGSSALTEYGIRLDLPAYRGQRILLPALSWCLARGRGRATVVAMVVVNIVAICLAAWLCGCIAKRFGRHALWGGLLLLNPGLIYTLIRGTPEAVELALLLGALLCILARRYPGAAVLLGLAVLAKETALLAAVAALVACVWPWDREKRERIPWYVGATAFAAYAALQLFVLSKWGTIALTEGHGNLGLPFVGVLAFAARQMHAASHAGLRELIYMAAVLAVNLGAAAVLVRRDRSAPLWPSITWALYVAMVFSLSTYVWSEQIAFLRAMEECWAFAAIIIIACRASFARPMAICLGLLWLYSVPRHGPFSPVTPPVRNVHRTAAVEP